MARPTPPSTAARGHDPNVPPGWTRNPTSPRRRAELAVLAAAGLAVAIYLTLFQVGVLDSVWDPFFSSRVVLELTDPVPDALAGVLAYATELVLLVPGGADRWRTRPLVCLALGLVLSAGAVVSMALIVIQPTVAGAWCTLCLVSAALSLVLFARGIGEARAALGHLRRAEPSYAGTGSAAG